MTQFSSFPLAVCFVFFFAFIKFNSKDAKYYLFVVLFVSLLIFLIRALADTDSDGKMNINEFSIACKLINLKLRGMEVPKALPPSLLASLSTGTTPTLTPTGAGSLSPMEATKTAAIAAAPIAAKPEIPVMPNIPMAAAVAPAAPLVPMPGAVPIVPGMVPGSLPGIVPQASMAPAAMAGIPPMQQMTGAVPVMPAAMQAGMMHSGVAGVPGVPAVAGMPVVTQPGAMPGGIPSVGMMPGGMVAPTVVPGAMPGAVPGMAPPIPPPAAAVAAKIVSPPTVAAALPTPPHSNPPSRNMSISERAPSLESP